MCKNTPFEKDLTEKYHSNFINHSYLFPNRGQQGQASGTRTSASETSEAVVTLSADPNNGAAGASGGGGPSNHDVTVRYSQSNGIEMNGYSRRGKSQSPEVTSWVQVPSSMRNGAINGQAWRLGKVFNENDEALINRKLPKELLLRIFSHLDVVSLCRCAQVSINSFMFDFCL